MDHVTDEEIGGFLAGRLDEVSRRRVARRLLSFFPAAEPEASDYDGPVDRAVASVLGGRKAFWRSEKERRERLAAALPERCEELLQPSPALEEAGLRGWAWVEALLGRSQEERFREPASMLDWALLAVAAAQSMDPQAYGKSLVADLQARAWAELANAFRVSEDFEQAEVALAEGSEASERGTGDLLLLARLYDVEASLRTDQRRLDEALKVLRRAHDTYTRLGDVHLAGRALIKKGINTHYNGQPEEAVTILRAGLEQVDAQKDPKLASVGQQALLDALAACGRFREASRLLLASGLGEAFAGEPLNLAKLRWIEGKIFAGLGKLARAEQVYLGVRSSFLEVGRKYESALAGLDLASVWLRQGKASQVRELAEELVGTFKEVGVQSEALKAVRFFREACRRERATPALVETVGVFLQRLEWQPQLQFVP